MAAEVRRLREALEAAQGPTPSAVIMFDSLPFLMGNPPFQEYLVLIFLIEIFLQWIILTNPHKKNRPPSCKHRRECVCRHMPQKGCLGNHLIRGLVRMRDRHLGLTVLTSPPRPSSNVAVGLPFRGVQFSSSIKPIHLRALFICFLAMSSKLFPNGRQGVENASDPKQHRIENAGSLDTSMGVSDQEFEFEASRRKPGRGAG